MPIQSINPATGVLLRRFVPLTEEALLDKIALADAAFAHSAEVPLAHRALCMGKLARLLESETGELAALITAEMGKPVAQSRAEIAKCARVCLYYAEHAARILTPEAIDISSGNTGSNDTGSDNSGSGGTGSGNTGSGGTGSHDAVVRWDPLGVVLAVMPWNFPFWQVFRFLAPALMAGNVGLLKHAPNVPQCALAIEALVRRAGFANGCFQALLIEESQVERVLADPRVVAVTVTGSESAGRAIAAQAGWFLKKSVLELGGSDPFIVMPSADLDAAVEAAVQARCVNSGQSCIAAKRFLIAEPVYEEFEARFVAGMDAMKVGDPTLEATQIGPLATAAQLDELDRQVRAALSAGARRLTGGERMVGKGYYYEPTVIAGLPRTAEVYRQEIFGPVAMLYTVRDMDQAIELANDTPFGLGASVWTRNRAEQRSFAAGLNCGAVFFNAPVASDPRLPFGGVKRSGYGRELSAAGMREFLNAKTVVTVEPAAVRPVEARASATGLAAPGPAAEGLAASGLAASGLA